MFFAEAAAGLLQPGDAAAADRCRRAAHPTSTAVIGDHRAVVAHRDFRGAAADVDIHHRAAVADRAGDRAGTVGRHHGLQIVAGADRDELAGLAGEQFADPPRVAAPHRDPGEDQRAGVDLVGIDHGVFVLLLEERAERIGVDLVLGRVGREQDVGLVEGLALGHDVAAVEALQYDAREHEVRGRRADVDPDAEDADLVLALQAAPGRGEENPAAGLVGLDLHRMSQVCALLGARLVRCNRFIAPFREVSIY